MREDRAVEAATGSTDFGRLKAAFGGITMVRCATATEDPVFVFWVVYRNIPKGAAAGLEGGAVIVLGDDPSGEAVLFFDERGTYRGMSRGKPGTTVTDENGDYRASWEFSTEKLPIPISVVQEQLRRTPGILDRYRRTLEAKLDPSKALWFEIVSTHLSLDIALARARAGQPFDNMPAPEVLDGMLAALDDYNQRSKQLFWDEYIDVGRIRRRRHPKGDFEGHGER